MNGNGMISDKGNYATVLPNLIPVTDRMFQFITDQCHERSKRAIKPCATAMLDFSQLSFTGESA
jgi:hypothetical protein